MDFTVGNLLPTQRDQILAGKAFFYSTAASGTNALAVAGTGSAPMLYNSKTSGVNVRILKIYFGMISGTDIEAYIYYGLALNPVVTLASTTYVAPVNALGSGAGNSSAIAQGTDGGWAPITVAIGAAPTMWRVSGMSLPGASAANGIMQACDNVDGSIIIRPGMAFFPYLSNAAGALVSAISILAVEDPIIVGLYQAGMGG